MPEPVEFSRLQRNGGSTCIIIPKPLLDTIGWKWGDRLALRFAGNKLVVERIPLERLALLLRSEEGSHV